MRDKTDDGQTKSKRVSPKQKNKLMPILKTKKALGNEKTEERAFQKHISVSHLGHSADFLERLKNLGKTTPDLAEDSANESIGSAKST